MEENADTNDISMENPTNKESYIELANLYCEHEDFIVFFDNYHKGLAQFMSKAMIYFANNDSRN